MENLKKQIQQAVDAFKSGRILEAEDLTRKLIDSNPKVVFLYNLMGLILSAQKEEDKALEYYEKGIKIDPNFAMIYNNLGLLFANDESDNIKAENFYKKAISLDKIIISALFVFVFFSMFSISIAQVAGGIGGFLESNFYDSEVVMVLCFTMALPFVGSQCSRSSKTLEQN